MFIQREPVVVGAAVRVVLTSALAFGLDLTAEQVAAIVISVETILALFTRQAVTPVANEDDEYGDLP